MKRHILAAMLLALLILALFGLALTIRIGQDERGVWTGQAPEVEVIYLPDRTGPAIWLYLGGHLVWHGEGYRREPVRPVVPVITPTPVRMWPMELKQAQRADMPRGEL